MGELRAGQRAAVEAEVQLTEVSYRGRRQLLCRVADGSGFLTLRFFHFTAQQQRALVRGLRIRCFGEARRGPNGLEFVHPEYQRIDATAGAAAAQRAPAAPPAPGHLTPIYPATEGITQGRLRQLVGLALAQLTREELPDWLPASLLADSDLPSLAAALEHVHRPPADTPPAIWPNGAIRPSAGSRLKNCWRINCR